MAISAIKDAGTRLYKSKQETFDLAQHFLTNNDHHETNPDGSKGKPTEKDMKWERQAFLHLKQCLSCEAKDSNVQRLIRIVISKEVSKIICRL